MMGLHGDESLKTPIIQMAFKLLYSKFLNFILCPPPKKKKKEEEENALGIFETLVIFSPHKVQIYFCKKKK